MTKEQKIALHDAWREIDEATKRMLTAQPVQMTAAAERLEKARLGLNAVVIALTA